MNTNSNGASGSLDSLNKYKIIGCLDDTSHEVLQILLGSKNHIGGICGLLEVLRDYLSCTRNTLDFLNDLDVWLQGALTPRINRLNTAIKHLKSDESKMVYVQTAVLKTALEHFQTAHHTLPSDHLSAVLDDQTSLNERLMLHRESINVYRRIMTATVLASVYIVCAAAITAPAMIAVTLAALMVTVAAINPTECRRWMSHVMGKNEDRGELVRVLIESETRMALEDLVTIRLMVQDLLNQIRSLLVDVAPVVNVRKDAVVITVIEDMEKKIEEFDKAVQHLESKRNNCYTDVTYARIKIVETTFGQC